MSTSKMRKGKVGKDKASGSIVTAKEAAQTAAAVGVAAAGGMLTHASPSLQAAFALLALFPPIFGMIAEGSARLMRGRADRFFDTLKDNWARDQNKTHEEVGRLLEDRRNDPNVADAIWRAVRGLMEAPNDAAAVPLGVLAAEYARDNRPADAFFRGTVRLLSELSQSELTELRSLLTWVLNSTLRARVMIVASDMESHGKGTVVVNGAVRSAVTYEHVPWFVKLRRDDPNQPGEPDSDNDAWILCATPPEDAGRLFTLLKATGLGSESTARLMGYSLLVEVERPVIERLIRVLREP